MYITAVYVENFGVLSDYKYFPKPGFNEIYAENGAGKSTLCAFIKAMFYGMPQTRTRKQLDEALRKKYKPWQPGVFGGYIEFVTDNKAYKITRTFGDKESEDTFALIDKATGLVCNDYTVNIGEELFGTDRDTFSNTAWICGKDTSFAASGRLYEALGEGVDMSKSASSFERAQKNIDEALRYYKSTGGRGVINQLQDKINNVKTEFLELEKEYAALKEELVNIRGHEEDKLLCEECGGVENEGSQWRKRLDWLDDYFSKGAIEKEEIERLKKENEAEKERNKINAGRAKRSCKVSLCAFICLIITALAVHSFIFGTLFCLAAAAVCIYFLLKNKKRYDEAISNIKKSDDNKKEYDELSAYKIEYEALSDMERQHDDMRKAADAQIQSVKESAINEKQDAILKKLADLRQEKMTLSNQLEQYVQKAEILSKTKQFMLKAKDSYALGYMESVISRMKQYMQCFDEDLSDSIQIDVNFDVSVSSGAMQRQIEYYSAGTKDIIWLCERFAVIDVLYKKEQPVMVLDDIFINLDDKMFERGKNIISKIAGTRQIIYFTCRKTNSIIVEN